MGRAHVTVFLVSILGVLTVTFAALGGTAKGIAFTPEGMRSIVGKDVCNFAGQFPEQFGVYLDGRKDHVVRYQQRDGIVAVFLLSKPIGRCGVVDAVLDLTPVVRKGETIEFKCYTAREGGASPDKWGHIIGLADNKGGLRRFVRARVAWRVNTRAGQFEELKAQSVDCDTRGYSD